MNHTLSSTTKSYNKVNANVLVPFNPCDFVEDVSNMPKRLKTIVLTCSAEVRCTGESHHSREAILVSCSQCFNTRLSVYFKHSGDMVCACCQL